MTNSALTYPWLAETWAHYKGSVSKHPGAILLSAPAGYAIEQLTGFLAQYHLCMASAEQAPCGTCRACHLYKNQAHPDLHQAGLTAGESIKVEQIRDILQKVATSGHQSPRQHILIQQAHLLTEKSYNALLKSLEEPAAERQFILVTNHVDKIPATIRSRCLHYQVKTVSITQVAQWLQVATNNPTLQMAYELCAAAPIQIKSYLAQCDEDAQPVALFVQWLNGKISPLALSTALSQYPIENVIDQWLVLSTHWFRRQQGSGRVHSLADNISRPITPLAMILMVRRMLATKKIVQSTMALTANYQLDACLIDCQAHLYAKRSY